MIDGLFVLDAVTHAYNHLPENWEDPSLGHAMVELAYNLAESPPDRQYAMSREEYLIDWQIPDLANLLFRESQTDVAVFHPLAIASFKDGYSSLAKAAEALERYPNRFVGAYACVDPLKGADALTSMEAQVDMLKPLGLKLYPTSWDGTAPVSWRMDDPKLIYPLYEKASELGLRHVAVHKAVPIGPFAVGNAYNPNDIETAATDFPHLNFEIVHGGLAFMEETAWLLARFSNIFVNMEIQNIIVERRPRAFADILLGLCRIGGNEMLNRLFWGSGGTLHHPQPGLEAFAAFEFPEDMLNAGGLFKPLQQITRQNKADMLAGTFARLHGLNLDTLRQGIAGDEFETAKQSGLPTPYSTLSHMQNRAAGPMQGDTIYA
ncbi:amidohydrolase family protein [Sphingomonas sp. 1P06PA]|uniref:amidohydrolase family protein n=1 Tax=Sphingomonas sp. 1P06PA TaxID=554121 RepID=UPI0039A533E7